MLLCTVRFLAIFSAIATVPTSALLAAHAPRDAALTGGFQRARPACALLLLAAAVIAVRADHTREESAGSPGGTRAARDQIPAPELTN